MQLTKKNKPPQAEHSTLQTMIHQEEYRYLTKDYLEHDQDVEVRKQLILWMTTVQEYGDYSLATLETAINIHDRYMLTASGADALQDLDQYQLAAVTAFYVASKQHEFHPFSARTLASPMISDLGQYTEVDIISMEWRMLQALRWNVNPPTSIFFVAEIVNLLPGKTFNKALKDMIQQTATIQALGALGSYEYLIVRKSAIAVAAVMNALRLFRGIWRMVDVPSFLRDAGYVTSTTCNLWEQEQLSQIQRHLMQMHNSSGEYTGKEMVKVPCENYTLPYAAICPGSPRSSMDDLHYRYT